MISIKRTNSNDPDFKKLISQLDGELRVVDGEEHVFYAQLNKTNDIDAVVAYIGDIPVGSGAIRPAEDSMEIKRMYTVEEHRGKGIASAIVSELEAWTKE